METIKQEMRMHLLAFIAAMVKGIETSGDFRPLLHLSNHNEQPHLEFGYGYFSPSQVMVGDENGSKIIVSPEIAVDMLLKTMFHDS